MHRDALRRGFLLEADSIDDRLRADHGRAVRAALGLFRREPSVWSQDAGVQKSIANRLGWLDSPAWMSDEVGRLMATADAVRQAGIEDVVLLGMGGSSLAPEVLRAVIGVSTGRPRLHMLDSTDPAAVRALATDARRTLYVLASKSGTTIEPNSLAAHFIHRMQSEGVSRWADHVVAITDPGTELAARARAEGFRDLFINPADIGGRYSALSFFGLVPAALMGQDVADILRWGAAMLDEARAIDESHPDTIAANPAVALGLLMAAGARAGRDKLTLVVPPSLESFGLWVEQLVAESTGKHGVGIVPVAGETLGEPLVYGSDRVFVRLRVDGDRDEERRDRALRALAPAPIATIAFTTPAALGAEFMRWEIATAVAGALLGINPFDEPNVQQAKDATRVLLDGRAAGGQLPVPVADLTGPHGITWTLTPAARNAGRGQNGPASILTQLGAGDYLAVLAYLGPAPALGDVLHRFRMTVRDRARVATMSGYGPRYLHSTGQLHKGGPNTGVFVLVTAHPAEDVAIPGAGFSFGTLEFAQALGDFASLATEGRRAVHVHLPSPDPRLLQEALEPLLQALA